MKPRGPARPRIGGVAPTRHPTTLLILHHQHIAAARHAEAGADRQLQGARGRGHGLVDDGFDRGHQAIVGTRTPPSYMSRLPPRRGPLERKLLRSQPPSDMAPLSLEKITNVLSATPNSCSLSSTAPTVWSRYVTMPAKVALGCCSAR